VDTYSHLPDRRVVGSEGGQLAEGDPEIWSYGSSSLSSEAIIGLMMMMGSN
jgi:hypothetical protein